VGHVSNVPVGGTLQTCPTVLSVRPCPHNGPAMSFTSFLQRTAGRPAVRRLVNFAMTRYARHRAGRLDRLGVERAQRETLLELVWHARDTRFGKDHGFASVRTVADYRGRVPLGEYESFWSRYWQPAFPFLAGVTWPDPIPYFALSSGTTSGATKYLPLSRQMLSSNNKAALTTLALFLNAYPDTPLFTGRIFFLGGSTDLQDLSARYADRAPPRARRSQPILGGDLSGITNREASPLLRPYSFPPVELALIKDWDKKMRLLAEHGAALPITMLSGVPSWLLVLFERLRQVTGKQTVAEVWPMLRLVLHGGTNWEPYRALFEEQVGSPAVKYVETYPASEGFVAVEDPRFGLLRLIPDHGIFFEFVPADELGSERPTRHGAWEVGVGVNYAVVLTTCAGLWGYVLGDTVIFERRSPPLLRFSGRTKYFLSAFGEHLISEEVERAVAQAARATGSAVVDFHVGPVFPEDPSRPGHHRYLVEFAGSAPEPARFAAELDGALCRLNEDYEAHRQGDLTMRPPEVVPVRRGGFADWMRAQGKLGGQHKVPRMDNTGRLTRQMGEFFAAGDRARKGRA
jgi:hypothetical protein